jgi:hypothetical protein
VLHGGQRNPCVARWSALLAPFPLLFLSHLSLSQVAILGRSSACLGGWRYGSEPPEVGSAVLALGSMRVAAASPPIHGVLGPQRAALCPIANACWCKRRLARLPRCFGPRLQLRTYRSEAPCHALPLPLGIRWGPEPEARVRWCCPPTHLHRASFMHRLIGAELHGLWGLARHHSPTIDGVGLGPQSTWPVWWQPASWPAGSPKQSFATPCEHVLLQAPPSATFPLGCSRAEEPLHGCQGMRFGCGLTTSGAA